MTTRLVILGTGGTSRDILDTVCDINDARPGGLGGEVRYQCVAFLDDDASLWGSMLQAVPVVGPLVSASDFQDCVFVCGIGSPDSYRKKPDLVGSLGIPPASFATIVHPSASVSRTARLGRGTVVLQHVTIASNVHIGDHVVVLPNSILSHDVRVGDFTCIAGGTAISGDVRIGHNCYIGTGAAIIGGVTIGDGALVGMGSVVRHDVEPDTVMAGNPARVLRTLPSTNPSSSAPSGLSRLSTQSPSAVSR